jgi:hypothetical protein
LALALVGQPTGMFCSISLTNRGLAWGNTAGFLVFAAVMVAATCLGLRAKGLVRRSDFKLRGGWLGSAGVAGFFESGSRPSEFVRSSSSVLLESSLAMTPPPPAPTHLAVPIVPTPGTAAPVLPLLNYADPVLLKRLSRLSIASFCLALTGVPATFAAGWVAGGWLGGGREIAEMAAYLLCHGACLALGLWANALIKTIRGRVVDVIMAGVGVAVGCVALVLPILFILGLLLMGIAHWALR